MQTYTTVISFQIKLYLYCNKMIMNYGIKKSLYIALKKAEIMKDVCNDRFLYWSEVFLEIAKIKINE